MSDSRASKAPEDHLLRTLAAVPVSARILDLGCGEGRRMERLEKLGFELYGCDVDPDRIEAARRRLGERWDPDRAHRRLVTANATSLDFPENFFDWVVAHRVYHRATGREVVAEMVAETRRVLKDGGWVHCVVPARAEDEEPDQVRPGDDLVERRNGKIAATFTPDALTGLMEEADLSVAEEPAPIETPDGRVLCGIFRNTEADHFPS